MATDIKPLRAKFSRAIARRGYSARTDSTYAHWIKRYIQFHANRHPQDMGTKDVESFLDHLAIERGVSSSTLNIALNALRFLYNHVVENP